ncbi:hypothetical protein OOK29_42510 [Streptomyces phaeochromogenes]|uniref:hypothetical protein n=1 Tax=Streptomyces TaxID=1883 RepID=UPI0022508E7F|nr:hypothetical protein [Streptomyces phaeochromogenes]MCX5604820.1 hypothetical protein [Streptomyces phaeochromogenes]
MPELVTAAGQRSPGQPEHFVAHGIDVPQVFAATHPFRVEGAWVADARIHLSADRGTARHPVQATGPDHTVHMMEYGLLIVRAPALAAAPSVRGVRLTRTIDTGTLRAGRDDDPSERHRHGSEPRRKTEEDRRKIEV